MCYNAVEAKGKAENEEYSFPYEERDALIERGLLKKLKIKM